MQKITLLICCWLTVSILYSSAFDHLQTFVDFGVRTPNSKGIKKARHYIVQELSSLKNCKIEKDSFFALLDNKLQLGVNIVAKLNPEKQKRVLLCTHYDTRICAEKDTENPKMPVPGANDGASGAAALLTLAHLLADSKTPLGIDFVFFDLEDQGDSNSSKGWILGSKNYAKKITKEKYGLVILLDMIAGKEQKFCQERFAQLSFPRVNEKFWKVAGFSLKKGKYIYDDHLPFLWLGIPTIAVIGWPFPQHHTTQDTPEHCSTETLDKVIDATFRFVKLYLGDQHNSK